MIVAAAAFATPTQAQRNSELGLQAHTVVLHGAARVDGRHYGRVCYGGGSRARRRSDGNATARQNKIGPLAKSELGAGQLLLRRGANELLCNLLN